MTSPKDEDNRLWRAVTEGVLPLKQKPGNSPKTKPASTMPSPPARTVSSVANFGAATQAVPPPKQLPDPPPLVMGRDVGIDKHRTRRLKRGQISIEARLDLHGLTQAEAYARLNGFLADAQDRGLRCVLVITGKGHGGGVLRRMVPRWLNLSPNRGRVLFMSQAQPKHGGDGAVYLLIKRRRLKNSHDL